MKVPTRLWIHSVSERPCDTARKLSRVALHVRGVPYYDRRKAILPCSPSHCSTKEARKPIELPANVRCNRKDRLLRHQSKLTFRTTTCCAEWNVWRRLLIHMKYPGE
jgi:hypothetical protein